MGRKKLTPEQQEELRQEALFRGRLVSDPDWEPDLKYLEAMSEDLKHLLQELAYRKIEALRLYEPLPAGEGFHKCDAPERLARGSNRAGKTLVTAVEVARAVTGQDPFKKYPVFDGRCFAVGKDGKHVADVMYRKLFKPNAFRIVRDLKTEEWRTWKPWIEDDANRKYATRPAPPLVPRRFVREIAWENKKASQPQIVVLNNGWEINFFSSLGKPPQGSDIDLAWLDEEIIDPEWYPEMAARLVDRKGKFIWSATPQSGTDQLFDLSLQAEKETERKDPRVVEFLILLEDNPYIPSDQKELLALKYSDPEQYRVRIKGEFAILRRRVYPEFNSAVHGVGLPEPPPHWTRYAITDPGRQLCVTTFIAVPPPEESKKKYVYDELYIENCTAIKYGQEMAQKCKNQQFQAFIIDSHMAKQTDMGSGATVGFQYSQELKNNNIASIETGHGFHWGSDDIKGGIEAVRSWLYIGSDGRPTLLFVAGKTNKLCHQMERYHNKMIKNVLTDEPAQINCDGPDTLRYAAMHKLPYVKPPPRKKREGYAMKAMRAKREKQRRKSGRTFINLAPGA